MIFKDVYTHDRAPDILYWLLSERKPEQSISHVEMPTLRQHISFIDGKPYPHWYLLFSSDENQPNICYGSIYLTSNREVGLFIFDDHQGKGHGKTAFAELTRRHGYPIFANVNPANKPSCDFWESLGGKVCQMTYRIESSGESE